MHAGNDAADPARHYDRVTAAWEIILGDDLHHGLFDHPDTDLVAATYALTRKLDDVAGVRPGDRILDLGCGTGTQAVWLAERHPDSRVIGVTSSAVGAASAQRRGERSPRHDRIEFRCADALASGLGTASFEVVWLLESSQYLVPRARLMSECARLLVPGGRLALCDVVLNRPLEMRDLRRLHGDLGVLRETFGEATLGTVGEYREAAVAAGFTITREVDLSDRVLPTFERWRRRARGARPELVSLIGEAGIDTFVAGCDVMERFFGEGIVGYSLIAATVDEH